LNPLIISTSDSVAALPLPGAKVVDASHSQRAQESEISILSRRLAAGDEAAFAEFHRLYFDRLYQFLLVVARGSEDEAREALQLTLLRVVRYAREFETEAAFWDWLKVIARSAARDAGRKAQRYSVLLRKFALRFADPRPAAGPEDADVLREILEDVLLELEPVDRSLIEGKYIEEESVRELSTRLGLTEKTVESRLVRLRRELRARLIKKLRKS
jgi:RNA polymerase sigma factor (sigma-70 family)